MAKILVLHGPNLNLLGTRETEHYGHTSLNDINTLLQAQATAAGHSLTCQQSQSESTLIDTLHQAKTDNTDFLIFNPAAFTHTSVALRDAMLAIAIPFIEVHLSNPYQREPFRQHSYFSDIAKGVISGLGVQSYQLALTAAMQQIATHANQTTSS